MKILKQTLVINLGEYEFTNFNRAVKELKEEFGYEGFVWDMVVASDDFEILCEFLLENGIDAELINE